MLNPKDQDTCGHHRTKSLIVDIYDRMREAIATAGPHQTLLGPPSRRPRRGSFSAPE